MTSSVRRSYGVFGNLEKSLELHQQQLAPFELYKDNSLDGMLRFCPKIGCSNLLQRSGTRTSFFYRGLATQPAQNMDTSISKQVKPKMAMRTRMEGAISMQACFCIFLSAHPTLVPRCERYKRQRQRGQLWHGSHGAEPATRTRPRDSAISRVQEALWPPCHSKLASALENSGSARGTCSM